MYLGSEASLTSSIEEGKRSTLPIIRLTLPSLEDFLEGRVRPCDEDEDDSAQFVFHDPIQTEATAVEENDEEGGEEE